MRWPLGGRKQQPNVPRRRLEAQTTRSGQPKPASQETSNQTFRRNRTLTGTTSHDVRSATENIGSMQSPRATAHHLRRRRRKLGGLLLGGLIGALVVVSLLHQLTAEMRVAVVGQVRPLTESQQMRIVEPINAYLSTRPLERFRLLLNHDKLLAYLQAQGIRDIELIDSVEHDDWGRSVVTVKVREPVARWSIAGQEHFVDRLGNVFAVNYFDTPTVTIRDDSGISARSEVEAQAVTSSRFLAFVGRTVGLVNSYGVDVDSVVIPPNTTRQLELVVSGDPAVAIKMTIDRPAGEQAEDAARAYRHLAEQGSSPRYIDVRVSGMAYYRSR